MGKTTALTPSVRKLRSVKITMSKLMVLVVTLFIAGCAGASNILTMDPTSLEKIRSGIETVGVSLSPNDMKTEVLLPAKGVWGGFKRGFVAGATMPIMIGFVAPVPGGTALGAILSPLGAIVGGVHGMTTAQPAEEIEDAVVVLETATETIRDMGLRETFLQDIVTLGNERTALKFVTLQEKKVSGGEQTGQQLSSHSTSSVDVRLVVDIHKSGMSGRNKIDPPMDVFVQIGARLIRSSDDVVLLEEKVICTSDEQITLKEWSDQRGLRMVEEFKQCTMELAEKVIDDFFMVYPIKWHEE